MKQQVQDQLIDIEMKLQFQEDTIQQLDKVIVRQQTVIDELSRRVQGLEHKSKEINDSAETDPRSDDDEKPPHY